MSHSRLLLQFVPLLVLLPVPAPLAAQRATDLSVPRREDLAIYTTVLKETVAYLRKIGITRLVLRASTVPIDIEAMIGRPPPADSETSRDFFALRDLPISLKPMQDTLSALVSFPMELVSAELLRNLRTTEPPPDPGRFDRRRDSHWLDFLTLFPQGGLLEPVYQFEDDGLYSGNFRRKFPGALGLLSLSRIGYNAARDQAMLAMTWDCRGGCAQFFVLKRDGQSWRILTSK